MGNKITELKKDISLVSIVEAAGVELTHTGSKYRGLCPLHDERTPSFFVFQDNRFKCFGCGESGDAIDFTQKMYGLTFQDALKQLGIEQGRITPELKKEIARRKRGAKLKAEFEDWITRYCNWVSDLWFDAKELMENIHEADLDLYASMLHRLPVWKYHREICIWGTDKEKYLLYKDIIKRGPKWKNIST